MSTVFNITAADVRSELNPLAEAGLFSVGSASGQWTDSHITDVIARFDEMVLSMLPERYRRMARQVEGEIVVSCATSGQSSFSCGLAPVTAGTLKLFVDWGGATRTSESTSGDWYRFNPGTKRPYAQRTDLDALDSSAYTLTPSTGLVVLATPLAARQTVYADYQHTSMGSCSFLRKIVLDLIATHIAKRVPEITVEAFNSADRDEQTAKALIAQIQDGMTGIDTLDNLKLVADYETRESRSGRSLSMGGYW